jgi:tetratricopeptide (TPR) repeat protein
MRARDEDVCPLRALTPMRNIVVDVAEVNDVPVIDFVGMMEKRAQDGIPGDESFLDHVHPTVEGHRLLALTLLDELQAMGIVKSGPTLAEETIDEVTARVKGRLDHRAHANALRNLAKVLRWAGKFEQSAKLAVKAVKGLPDDAEAHYMAADARWQSGHLDIAVAEYELALSIDPNCLGAILQLGSLLLEKGEPEAAKNYLQRAVQLAPDKADPHFRLANALFALEDFDGAWEEYEESLRLDSELADAHKNLALIAIQREELDTAVDHFEQALDIDPADAVAHCELGYLFVETKKLDLAVEEFSAALLLNPDHVPAYLGLGHVAEAQGDLDEAAAMYGQVLDIDPDNAKAREKLERVAKPK